MSPEVAAWINTGVLLAAIIISAGAVMTAHLALCPDAVTRALGWRQRAADCLAAVVFAAVAGLLWLQWVM